MALCGQVIFYSFVQRDHGIMFAEFPSNLKKEKRETYRKVKRLYNIVGEGALYHPLKIEEWLLPGCDFEAKLRNASLEKGQTP